MRSIERELEAIKGDERVSFSIAPSTPFGVDWILSDSLFEPLTFYNSINNTDGFDVSHQRGEAERRGRKLHRIGLAEIINIYFFKSLVVVVVSPSFRPLHL